MVFDIKMKDFRYKPRLVAGGHMTKAPATIRYASVMSKATVKIALMVCLGISYIKGVDYFGS